MILKASKAEDILSDTEFEKERADDKKEDDNMSENQEGKDTTCVRRNHVFKQTIFIAVWNWGELPTMASAPAAKDHQGQKENKKEQESKAEEEKRQKSWWFWKSQNEQGKRFDKTPRV